ncbi:hypothetical protein V3C99_005695 [Haemonchus contortus]
MGTTADAHLAEDAACNVWLQLLMPALLKMWHAMGTTTDAPCRRYGMQCVVTTADACLAVDVACNVWLQLLMPALL